MGQIAVGRGLAAADILDVWERGAGQHPIERALTMLGAAFPEQTRGQLAGLSIGRRDGHLFAVRAHTFGRLLEARADCPACGERPELTLDLEQLGLGESGPASPSPDPPGDLALDGYALRFRLPCSDDLAAVAGLPSDEAARRALVRRCVLAATLADAPCDVDALPEPVLAALAERMDELDPLATVDLALTCPACGHGWQTSLDIGEILWSEIAGTARRLLQEVHTLARAYGWREADILALGATRRRAYLEMVG
jgi:hypothetical protein